MLAGVGLLTADQLRARGALETYLALSRANITSNLNMLWALVGALDPWPEGTDWREIAAGEQRLPLLLAVESREQARDAVLEAANGPVEQGVGQDTTQNSARARRGAKGGARKTGGKSGANANGDAVDAAVDGEESPGPFGNWAPGLPFEEAGSRSGKKKG